MDTISIKFAEVDSAIETIKTKLIPEMEAAFDEFGRLCQGVHEDGYTGSGSNSFYDSYVELKPYFTKFAEKMDTVAENYHMMRDNLAKNDENQAKKAQEVNAVRL